MATLYISNFPPARIEKAVQRKKSYVYACSSCKGTFYFCGVKCNYNYCPRCGIPFERGTEDANKQ